MGSSIGSQRSDVTLVAPQLGNQRSLLGQLASSPNMSANRAEQEQRAEDAKKHGMNPRTTSSCYGRGVMYGGMGAYDAPLHLAAKAGNAEAVRDLVLSRANVNAKREVCCHIALFNQAMSACCLQD